ncbi:MULTISPECIES: IS3 family transposase [Brevibacillus]|uniref:IS3 family transposase n=1 Tax=Brevibacillus TaxID=55080 RepID=UPI0009D9B8AC|nr:IS3 family transposase [Brevibacillus borstelensis]NOU53593.1 IS3 family transposase [Brevibacillus borstelensis]RNB62516.1 hypothetical protein EDM54_14270 [Brevibacillus borstelensis]
MKAKLQEEGITVSRRRIGRLMKKNGLVSVYTVAKYKVASCNDCRSRTNLIASLRKKHQWKPL